MGASRGGYNGLVCLAGRGVSSFGLCKIGRCFSLLSFFWYDIPLTQRGEYIPKLFTESTV